MCLEEGPRSQHKAEAQRAAVTDKIAPATLLHGVPIGDLVHSQLYGNSMAPRDSWGQYKDSYGRRKFEMRLVAASM